MKIIFIICLAILSYSNIFSQLGIQVGLKPNEIAPTGFYKLDVYSFYAFQVNFLNFTLIPKDPYNKKITTVSTYTFYEFGTVLAAGFFLFPLDSNSHEGCTFQSMVNLKLPPYLRETFKYLGFAIIVPAILSNSQQYFNLYGNDSSSTSPISISVLAGLQTDYFNDKSYDVTACKKLPLLPV